MTLFCVVCGLLVPEARVTRNFSHFCSDECRRKLRVEIRKALRQRRCNACSRLLSPRERQRLQEGTVRRAHSGTEVRA